MDTPPRNFSKSAARALDVMEFLASEREPRRAADIAEALGMARSSADQLLKSMTACGYLATTAVGKLYFPTTRLAPFGQFITELYPEVHAWKSLLRRVADETEEIVTLSIRSGCYMQIMSAVRPSEEDPDLDVGKRIPVVGSALGSAAMMKQPEREIRYVYNMACRNRVTMPNATFEAPFLDEIPLFRMKGYARRHCRHPNREGEMRDYWSLAVNLPSGSPVSSAVLGLAGPLSRVRSREQQYINAIRRSMRVEFGTLN